MNRIRARQSDLLLRLRQTRTNAARAVLVDARTAADAADGALHDRDVEAGQAGRETGFARHRLAGDAAAAEARLAELDRCRFAETVADQRRLEAERIAAAARFEEDRARAVLLQAQRRHDALDTHVTALRRRSAVRIEEQAALDEEG